MRACLRSFLIARRSALLVGALFLRLRPVYTTDSIQCGLVRLERLRVGHTYLERLNQSPNWLDNREDLTLPDGGRAWHGSCLAQRRWLTHSVDVNTRIVHVCFFIVLMM